MTQTAFVTGGTGFLGLNLIRLLTGLGWTVTALHRHSSDLTYLNHFPVTLAAGAVEDPASVLAAMPEGLDAVFHVAGDVSFWSGHRARQIRANVDGTRNVAQAALTRGAKRFVHTSSMAVYGVQTEEFDETAQHLGLRSKIGYLRTKAQAEEEIQEAVKNGLDAVILNPANIVGLYDAANWGRLFRLVAENKLPGIPPGAAPFCSAAEVAQAHLTAWERGRTGENYLLAGTQATYLQAFQVVGDLLGRTVEKKTVSPAILRAAGWLGELQSRVTHKEPEITPEMATLLSLTLRCRSDKALSELGFRAVPLETMFAECYEWLQAKGS